MTFCTRCGNNLNYDDAFCGKCGSPARPGLAEGGGHREPPGDLTPTAEWDRAMQSEGGGHREPPGDTPRTVNGDDFEPGDHTRQHYVPPSDSGDGVRDPGPRHQTDARYSPLVGDAPSVDRKMRFADGVLVLTHEDLVLYGGDERDEIKRIPIRRIKSCKGGAIKRMAMRAIESSTRGKVRRALVIKKWLMWKRTLPHT